MTVKKKEFRTISGDSSERIGLVGWLTLYTSGAILFFLTMIHILAIHFFSTGMINTAAVQTHFRSTFLTTIIMGLLFMGLFHGLVGLRRVVLDLEILDRKSDQVFIWVLIAVGLGLAGFGVKIFNGFTSLP